MEEKREKEEGEAEGEKKKERKKEGTMGRKHTRATQLLAAVCEAKNWEIRAAGFACGRQGRNGGDKRESRGGCGADVRAGGA